MAIPFCSALWAAHSHLTYFIWTGHSKSCQEKQNVLDWTDIASNGIVLAGHLVNFSSPGFTPVNWNGEQFELPIDDIGYLNDDLLTVGMSGLYQLIESDPFRRGDVNMDSLIDLADVIASLGQLFEQDLIDCSDASDINDDSALDVSDPVWLLSYLFASGSEPPPPFAVCGLDGTMGDGLICAAFAASACP